MIAAITSSCMENPEYSGARAEPPAAIADPVVYDFLSRAVVRGERITAAMLAVFLPGRPWQGRRRRQLRSAMGRSAPGSAVTGLQLSVR
jgi:hypothetical protein